jgi:PAS domain S-box-containing protein
VAAAIGLKRGLIVLIAVAIAATIVVAGDILLRRDLADASREQLRGELSFLAGRLSAEIEASEHLGRGFAAVIAANGGMPEADFNEACLVLMTNEPKIRNISLVIGTVITYNCPLDENRSTIGVDLRDRADQWPAFARMQETGRPDIAGPVKLVQGGWAIIARTPIMMRGNDGRHFYWGALSIPLRIEGLLNQAGISDGGQHLNIAIRGNHNSSLAPDILFGDPSVFEGDAVTVPIPFPDGDWIMGGVVRVPVFGYGSTGRQQLMVFAIALLCSSLFLMTAFYLERRRRLESESNRNRDLLRAFMENSPIAMYVKDLEGRYIDLNAEARHAFKVGGRPYIGVTSSAFFPHPLAELLNEEDERAKAGDVVRTERQAPAGACYEFERETKFPVTDRHGKVIAIGGYLIDLSSSKQAEARLIQALHRAEAANRAKSEFLATMSHELRTPLNAIIGYSDLIKHEIFGAIENKRYAEYIGSIHQSGQQLLELLGGLIDLSTVESGHLEIRLEAVSPAEVVKDCRAIMESLAREHQHELVFDEKAIGTCSADRRLLRQALLNLASNAAKYTRKGGRITCSTEDRGPQTVFRVADTGIGMTAAEIERALQPFTRLSDPMRAEVGGSGIGLTLVKRLVEAMGGTLNIASQPGAGTEVEIILPRR